MADLTQVPNPPSITRKEFNCPHCGAHSSQTWFKLGADPLAKAGVPTIPSADVIEKIKEERDMDQAEKSSLIKWVQKTLTGLVFIEDREGKYFYHDVTNLHLSQCFTCKDVSVWKHDALLFPSKRYSTPANADLPVEIKSDYAEASEIADQSPRGAAAILRLAIQKLCIHLGQPGKNINDDIAALVKNGLDVRIQQALDIVRVVGNNAVHPGQMDIKDDAETVKTLFGLVNLISEKMISEPKHVQALFDSLPEGARKQIEERDKKA